GDAVQQSQGRSDRAFGPRKQRGADVIQKEFAIELSGLVDLSKRLERERYCGLIAAGEETGVPRRTFDALLRRRLRHLMDVDVPPRPLLVDIALHGAETRVHQPRTGQFTFRG